MHFTLSVYNISSCHFSKRRGKLFEEVFWTQFLLDEWVLWQTMLSPWLHYLCQVNPWLTEPSWQVRSWAWKSWMILSDISNPARQPALVEDEECVMASGSALLVSLTFISWQQGSSGSPCWNESQPGNDPCIQRVSDWPQKKLWLQSQCFGCLSDDKAWEEWGQTSCGWVVSWFCNESQLTDKAPWKQPDLFHLLLSGMIPLCASIWAQRPVSFCWRCLHWQQEKRKKAEARVLTSAVLLDLMEYLGYVKDAYKW